MVPSRELNSPRSCEKLALLTANHSEKATWRWCFYINLPVGGLSMAFMALCLNVPSPKDASLQLKAKMNQLDLLGTAVFMPCMICLILALQWGGTTYNWSDGRIIALLVVFGVLLAAFVCIQVWKGDNATVPPRIICQRSIAFASFYSLCSAASMMIFVFVSLPVLEVSLEKILIGNA